MIKAALTFGQGQRTTKLVMCFFLVGAYVAYLAAPDHLEAAGVFIAALGAGAASIKYGNAMEAKHEGGGAS